MKLRKALKPLPAAALALCLLALAPSAAPAVQSAGSAVEVSITAPDGWISAKPEDAAQLLRDLSHNELRVIGIDGERTVLLAMNIAQAKDIVPVISIAVADVGGLDVGESDLEKIEREIEERYSDRLGTPFKLLMIENSSLGGLLCARLTGIYRWRTVNIKILQYLVPGEDRLYAVTYAAKEREFRDHLESAEGAMNTLMIGDAPLRLGWLWETLRWVGLLAIVLAIVWLTIIAASNRPQRGGESGLPSESNPFLRR